MKYLHKFSPKEKLDMVIVDAWDLFVSKFVSGRFSVTKEAPFQHQFANVIRSIGEQYCFSRTETFIVDLETKMDDDKGIKKYIDITCYFYDEGKLTAKGAIELKFKLKSQSADDLARIDAYEDIEELEDCLERGYDGAYFCMITDYSLFTRQSAKGTTGDIFSMRNGYTPPVDVEISNPKCKGRENAVVKFNYPHTFMWDEIDGYFFLLLDVNNRS